MKVPFFLLSFALHVVILTAPVSHMGKTQEVPLPVTLVLETMSPAAQISSAPLAPRNRANESARRQLKQAGAEKEKTAGKAQPEIAEFKKKPPQHDAVVSVTQHSVDRTIETARLDEPPVDPSATLPTALSNESQLYVNRVREKTEVTIDEHLSERNQGNSTAPEPVLLRANYSYAPKPEYPDQARREGWEGTVLLAILVDAEGRPETIVLSRSSGFASLDTAAQETVKHWRFQPARYGNKGVQSWVKVPIVFTLAE